MFSTINKPTLKQCEECDMQYWGAETQIICDSCANLKRKIAMSKDDLVSTIACINPKCNNMFWEDTGFSGYCTEYCHNLHKGIKNPKEPRQPSHYNSTTIYFPPKTGKPTKSQKLGLLNAVFNHPMNNCTRKTLQKECYSWLVKRKLDLDTGKIKKIKKRTPKPAPKHTPEIHTTPKIVELVKNPIPKSDKKPKGLKSPKNDIFSDEREELQALFMSIVALEEAKLKNYKRILDILE